jgi:membrane-bound lytic murein transglycosylase A
MLCLEGCGFFRPPRLLIAQSPPTFTDDTDRASLVQAVERQLDYLEKLQADSAVQLGGHTYTTSRLVDSARLFLNILKQHPSDADLNRLVREKFIIYQAAGRTDTFGTEMLVTGYYQPVFAGSIKKSPPFLYPLYAKPESLLVQNDPEKRGSAIGRIDAKGAFVPFWTRAQIENKNLLSGDELVYLQDPVDVYFLQIQGSGLIRFSDGSIRSVHFAASNGQNYTSIGKVLVDEHKIAKEDISMQTIREYLHKHPQERKHLLQENDRFVFFKWGKGEPRGSIGEMLTPGRSIAIDPKSLPMKTVAYIATRRPIISAKGEVIGWMPMQRFVLPQDTGKAIEGPGRVDIYWGSGPYAQAAAGSMQEEGRLYFLVKKE